MIHQMLRIVGICFPAVILLCSFLPENKRIKYTRSRTIAVDYGIEQTYVQAFQDNSATDSLYLLKTGKHIPVHYFRKVHTGVCFDNKCRELDIIVYWNITGRYLGFAMPEGEFLSKTEHEPFTEEEYVRLNELLADPSLPLGGISFEELIDASESETGLVDGVSGATSNEVSEMVVEGAAYTTHKLWNIVYGPTQDLVIQLTEKQLTPDLIDKILKSPDINDRVWALNRIDQSIELNSNLSCSLLDIISGEDYFLAYSAIHAIDPVHLDSDAFQSGLFSKYAVLDYGLKKMILEKLMTAPYLSEDIVISSRGLLEQLNGQQLGDFLEMYSIHSVSDPETCRTIATLLGNENRYISQKAYKFLKGMETSDSIIMDKLNAYEKQIPD
jgi:hypothetical protein